MRHLPMLIVALAALAGPACAGPGTDLTDTPARTSALASQRLITALGRAGDTDLVAVGQRGHVLRSADAGRNWVQAQVPSSSDLAGVQFVDAKVGHAVGHDGVVLRSEDGGRSWARVLDGRTANRLVLEQMQRQVDASGSEADRRLLAEAQRNAEAGPDKPFLDLWFSSATEGFVVGAYNLVFQTTDGGKTWLPWFDRTDNPKLLNLYAIRPAAGSLVIAGEAGLLLRLDPATRRFTALDSPYKGSWFGLVGLPGLPNVSEAVLAFGMRGHAFLSNDQGRTWRAVATLLTGSITAGDVAPDGRVLLVDQAGKLSVSADRGQSFTLQRGTDTAPLSSVVATRDAIVAGGPRGLIRIDANGAIAR